MAAKVRSLASRLPASRPTADERPVTVRLDDERLSHLQGLADIDGTNIADQIRQSVVLWVEHRRQAPDLDEQIGHAIARFRNSIGVLTGARERTSPTPAPPARAHDSEKSVTLRLRQANVDYLSSLAAIDDFTIADEVRAAVDRYVEARRSDPDLDDQIRETRARTERRLAKLRGERLAV